MLNITNWIKKRKKARIRSYIRGYNTLIKENRTDFVGSLRNELADNPINGEDLNEIFRSNKKTCFHQFLVYRLINVKFNKALLAAIANPRNEIYYPLPYLWRKKLMDTGFKVPKIYNNLLWFKFNLKWYLVGFVTGIIEIYNVALSKKSRTGKGAAFFNNLYPGNLLKNPNYNSENILEWFSSQEEAKPVNIIYHSCKAKDNIKLENKSVEYMRSPLPGNNSLTKVVKFLFWFMSMAIKSLFNEQNRLLLRQLVLEKIAKLSSQSDLCGYYLFHNSGHLLRPLWSYEAEKKGSKIIFYFYSTNISSFKVKNKKHTQDFQWQVTSWTNYWVWNYTQENFLKKHTIKSSDIKIKGIIPFSTSVHNFTFDKSKKKKTLLVFDVQPVKSYIYAALAPTVDFYSENNMIIFLNWINDLAEIHNLKVFIKRKRNSIITSKKYINKLNKLKKIHGWCEIEPEIEANYVCSKLQPVASISIPFTSAAIISKENKIPSAYLDPTRNLDKKFLINNEVSLLLSKEELFQWYIKHVLKNNEKVKN